MFEKSHFLQLRGSVFTNQPITCNNENISKLMELFANYVPYLIANNIPNGLLPIPIELQPWKLVSSQSSIEIVFNGNKIDILHTIGTIYNQQQLQEFADIVTGSVSKIVNTFSLEINRVAFAPNYALKISELGSLQAFARNIFAKNIFDNESIDSCNFNAVFRVLKQIGKQTNVKVNFLAKFEEGSIVERNQGSPDAIIPSLCFTFDINTYPVPGLKFDNDDISDFFAKSLVWNREFADFYLKI